MHMHIHEHQWARTASNIDFIIVLKLYALETWKGGTQLLRFCRYFSFNWCLHLTSKDGKSIRNFNKKFINDLFMIDIWIRWESVSTGFPANTITMKRNTRPKTQSHQTDAIKRIRNNFIVFAASIWINKCHVSKLASKFLGTKSCIAINFCQNISIHLKWKLKLEVLIGIA